MSDEKRSPEQMLNDAVSLLRAAYYTEIRERAEELKQAIVDDEIADREALRERIHEDCDGSQWVIYTFKAQCVCLASDNDGAYGDEYGEEGIVTDGAINWSVLAYAAMERDIYEALEAEGVDVNGDTKAELLQIEEEETEEDV